MAPRVIFIPRPGSSNISVTDLGTFQQESAFMQHSSRWSRFLITFSTISRWLFVLAVLIVPQAVWATTWQAIAGAQSTDEGTQALAFLPNELWVHVGDSITW